MGCRVQFAGGYRRHHRWELLGSGPPARRRILQRQNPDIQGKRPRYRRNRDLGDGRRNYIGDLAGLKRISLLRDGTVLDAPGSGGGLWANREGSAITGKSSHGSHKDAERPSGSSGSWSGCLISLPNGRRQIDGLGGNPGPFVESVFPSLGRATRCAC